MITTGSLQPISGLATAPAWGGNDDLAICYGVSPQTRNLIGQAQKLTERRSYSTLDSKELTAKKTQGAPSLEEQLFNALVNVKVYTAQVAMKMDQTWRKKLFRQLDSLLDPDEWFEGDLPLTRASFATFLKVMFLIKPTPRPGLGLSQNGDLIGAWTAGEARLTMTFQACDKVRVVLSRKIDNNIERAALETDVTRLRKVLSPYEPELWFRNDK